MTKARREYHNITKSLLNRSQKERKKRKNGHKSQSQFPISFFPAASCQSLTVQNRQLTSPRLEVDA